MAAFADLLDGRRDADGTQHIKSEEGAGSADVSMPDLHAIAKQDFSIRQPGKGLAYQEVSSQSESEDELPQIPDSALEAPEDYDYAPKTKQRKKRTTNSKTKKRREKFADQESEEEDASTLDTREAYFNGTAPRVDHRGEDLFCICRRGDLGKWMIGCDGCDEWYHGDCVNVSKRDEKLIDKFFCPRCEKYGHGTPTWKRKCRLPECRVPALVSGAQPGKIGSKYCSREHGLEFFRQRIAQSLISKHEIVSLIISSSGDVSQFQKMGDTPPPLPVSDLNKLSERDAKRMERIQARRAVIQSELERISKQSSCLVSMRDRAARVNASLKARKEKEICGLDFRLTLQDAEFLDVIDRPGFLDAIVTSGAPAEEMCQVQVKKCVRHAGWYQIKADGFVLDEELLRQELNYLNQEDEEIKIIARRLAK